MGIQESNNHFIEAKNKLTEGNQQAMAGAESAQELTSTLLSLLTGVGEMREQVSSLQDTPETIGARATQAAELYDNATTALQAGMGETASSAPLGEAQQHSEMASLYASPEHKHHEPISGLPVVRLGRRLEQLLESFNNLELSIKATAREARDNVGGRLGVNEHNSGAVNHAQAAIENISTWQGENQLPQS